MCKAKLNYYQSKSAPTRTKDPAKWFKSIRQSLCRANESDRNTSDISSENLRSTADKLQDIFTKPWNDHIPKICLVDPDGLPDAAPKLPSIGQVKKILKSLNPRKATGVDDRSPWTIKRYAEEPAVVIHDVICESINKRKYPGLCKHALVSPAPKVNPPENIETDFRQISGLPVLVGKVLKKVQIFMSTLVNRNYTLSSSQQTDVKIPRSGTKRHINSFIPRTTRLMQR